MENCRKYKIPLRYEEGTYRLGIDPSAGDGILP